MPDASPPAGRDGKRLRLNGLFPATVTPFGPDLAIDRRALERHLAFTLQTAGVSGIVINALVSEKPQLSPAEAFVILDIATRLRGEGQLIVAAVQEPNLGVLVERCLLAKDLGADAVLVGSPFDCRDYRGLAGQDATVCSVFKRLDQDVGLPMIVSQAADASGCAYSLDALRALAELPNVVAVQCDVGDDVAAHAAVWDVLHERVSVLAGSDAPALLPALKHGAHGALLSAAAILPLCWSRVVSLIAGGDTESADEVFDRMCRPILAAVFADLHPMRLWSLPGAVKETLVLLRQLPFACVRPPCRSPGVAERAAIAAMLQQIGALDVLEVRNAA